MQALEIIETSQSGEAMAHLARIAGITETEARAVAKVVVPELALALERNTLSRGGLADLVHALGQGHHEQILETPRAWSDPRVRADGEAVLAHILGSDGKARALTARASKAAGVGGGIVEMLLPILAQLLMGAIAKYAKGGLGDILSRLPIPGGGNSAPDRRDGDFDTGGAMGDRGGFELPKVDLPQGGFPMPPIPGSPDTGDGTARGPARDDRMRRPGGFEVPWPGTAREQPEPRAPGSRSGYELPEIGRPPPGGYPMPPIPQWPDNGSEQAPSRNDAGSSGFPFPFPQPGSGSDGRGNNPYGDLSDILRRGGSSLPSGNAASGGLWSVVRSVIGGALGFGNRGFIGWLIRFVVMRWGWRILQRVLLGRR